MSRCNCDILGFRDECGRSGSQWFFGIHDPIVLKFSGKSPTTMRSLLAKFGVDRTKVGYKTARCMRLEDNSITGIDGYPALIATL